MIRLGLFLSSAILLTGCTKKPAAAASRETLMMIREQMRAADPNALVGLVVAVEPGGAPFAAVSDMPTKEFHEDETVTFIDSNRKYLTNGVVRKIANDMLHVEWRKPGKDGRAPRVGDLLIRFKP